MIQRINYGFLVKYQRVRYSNYMLTVRNAECLFSNINDLKKLNLHKEHLAIIIHQFAMSKACRSYLSLVVIMNKNSSKQFNNITFKITLGIKWLI